MKIKKNIQSLNIKNCKVLKIDYKKALNELKDKKFDIIFLDPPYDMDVIEVHGIRRNYLNQFLLRLADLGRKALQKFSRHSI